MANDGIKFAVVFHGQRFLMDTLERRFYFWRRETKVLVSFYTTRFILADDANEALLQAKAIIESEIADRFERSDDSVIEVDHIWISESDYSGTGEGFTFYEPEDLQQ